MLFLLAYGLARNCGQPNGTLAYGKHRHDHTQQQPILRLPMSSQRGTLQGLSHSLSPVISSPTPWECCYPWMNTMLA